jgi:quercetin dioxygenase-like cupin family protein
MVRIVAMRTWQFDELGVEAHRPAILSSTDAARAIALTLPAGEMLQEHEVHEHAFLVVLGGRIEVSAAGGETVAGGIGLVAEWTAGERHEVRAVEDARLLIVLAPWPGDGHPGAMTLEDKANARARARERSAS